jgi:hypothetical protein
MSAATSLRFSGDDLIGVGRRAMLAVLRRGRGIVGKFMAIDTEQAAIRMVIATALAEQGESSGRGLDALFAMRQAEAIVKALEHAGYEIRRQR